MHAQDFDGKHILVTGGASGIGLATALLAFELGARVTVIGRSLAKLAAIPKPVRAIAADLTDAQEACYAFEQAGPMDFVCHCAAPPALVSPIKNLDLAAAEAHVQGRFWSAFNVAKCSAGFLTENGALAFIVGAMSQRPMVDRAIVSAAQSAVVALARGLALELAPRRVNTVVAGLTNTGMWDSLDPTARKSMFDGYAARTPAGIVGDPHHIASIILATLSNPYMTGSTVVVDGGSTLV
jgi:NAD(P)-dependent dehydrogenase (short-subunit alcohol dehydrogenase family)